MLDMQDRHRTEIYRLAKSLSESGELPEAESLVAALQGVVGAMCDVAELTPREFADVAINMSRHMAMEVVAALAARVTQ